MKCLELRSKPVHCGYHPIKDVRACAFLKGNQCRVDNHNKAVKRAFDAGLHNEPMPNDLMPANYRLPCES